MAQTLYGNGTFTSNGGFNIGSQAPIDSRTTVKQEQHLFEIDTYKGVKLYVGMIVSAEDTGAVYVLRDRDIYDVLNAEYADTPVDELSEEQKADITSRLKGAWKNVCTEIDADDVQQIIEEAVGEDLSEITQSITDINGDISGINGDITTINQNITSINNTLSWGNITPSLLP